MKLVPFVVMGLSAASMTAAMALAALALPPLTQVNEALQAGEADKALALLRSLPASDAKMAEAHNLECRVRLTLEQWNAAASECEQAVQLDSQNSVYRMWLGRALGEIADRATYLKAYSLAKRVREEFEESVRLNPRNADALEVLGDFYYQAPVIVGGGLDKAQEIAARLDKVDSARAHVLLGKIAEERKDYGTAEREFRQAIEVSAHPAFQWIAFAGFYSRRQRWTEMESALHTGMTEALRDKHAGVALYDGASVLTSVNRDPALAARMLEDYLACSAKTEEAPAFVAHDQLARIDDQLGDAAAANRERAAALAMAHDYKPAWNYR